MCSSADVETLRSPLSTTHVFKLSRSECKFWRTTTPHRHERSLVADLMVEGGQTALLLDADGFALAGAYVTADGHDVGQDVGAQLSGVSDEAARAMRHLDLGAWTSIVFETEVATFAMAPGPQDGLLLVAADRQTPIGFVRRVLEHAGERARRWVASMQGQGAPREGA